MDANSEKRSRAKPEIVDRDVSYKIVGCFFRVYNELGYGFLESIYLNALCVSLARAGLIVQREFPVHVFFDGVEVGTHRIDLLVERRIIVEVKASDRITDISKRQLRNYLSALDAELGILLHFGPRAEYYRILHKRRGRIEPHSPHSNNSDVV